MKSIYDSFGKDSSLLMTQLDEVRRLQSLVDLPSVHSARSLALGSAYKDLALGTNSITSGMVEAVHGIHSARALTIGSVYSSLNSDAALAANAWSSRLAEATRTAEEALSPLRQSLERARELSKSFESVRAHALTFENQFRLATQTDWSRVSEMTKALSLSTGFGDISKQIQALSAISSPMIKVQDTMASVRSITELTTIGAAVNFASPFSSELVKTLRGDLGDWRDADIDPLPLLDDPAARIAAYEDQGFRTELTDFPVQSFDAALTATHIRLGALSAELAPPPADEVPQFNVEGYQWLFVLERQIRIFIVERLQTVHPRWEQRLPKGMHDKWQEKKARELAEGKSEQPIINYADFADYVDIVLSDANWRDCFKDTFKHTEAIREGFNRLRPIRLIVAHMRILTSEELLLLNVEVRRLLRAMGYFSQISK